MSGLHGEEVVIGGNPTEAQRIVDLHNEQAKVRRMGSSIVDISRNGAAMIPGEDENSSVVSMVRPHRYSVE